MAFSRIFNDVAKNMVKAFTQQAKVVMGAGMIEVEVVFALPDKATTCGWRSLRAVPQKKPC